MTTLHFGLGVSTAPMSGVDPVAEAQLAEEVGFDFVSASDHLHGATPTYEPWTLLTWIAAATTRIRVASRVLAVPYRQPPVTSGWAAATSTRSSGLLGWRCHHRATRSTASRRRSRSLKPCGRRTR